MSRDKTFSDNDIIRLFLYYLTDVEQLNVFDFFHSYEVLEYVEEIQNQFNNLFEDYMQFFIEVADLIRYAKNLQFTLLYLQYKKLVRMRRRLVDRTLDLWFRPWKHKKSQESD